LPVPKFNGECQFTTLQNTEMGHVLPFHWMPKSKKAFSFRGAKPPDPLTRGSAPGPRWGSAPRPPL